MSIFTKIFLTVVGLILIVIPTPATTPAGIALISLTWLEGRK